MTATSAERRCRRPADAGDRAAEISPKENYIRKKIIFLKII